MTISEEEIKLRSEEAKAYRKEADDRVYTYVLISLGCGCILLATVSTIMQEMHMGPKTLAMFWIGLFLIAASSMWKFKDKKKIKKVREEVVDLETTDEYNRID